MNAAGKLKAAPARLAKPAPAEKLFAFAAGCWIAISLLKFGNPVIFGNLITSPANFAEFLLAPWPVGWGYLMGIAVALLGFRFATREFNREHWPIAALGVWLVWQLFSQAQSVDQRLSIATLVHFAFCAISLLIGWLSLGRLRAVNWFWAPVLAGFGYVLLSGFDQHYGGLESTRRAFYEQPNWQLYPKEYLLKIQSDRVFSTLVYPNAFAGVILLLGPVLLWKAWELIARWDRRVGAVAAGLLAYMSAACLYWTASKGGWLIALLVALTLVLHFRLPPKVKLTIMSVSLVLGLVFFFVRFSAYFQKGATSVSARFIYWQAAAQTVRDRPLFGTGPGTFAIAFRKIKPPDAEMAKLTHNDYLEQARDSGIFGGLAYAAFVWGSLYSLYRKRPAGDWAFLLVWLGLAAWAAQSVIEFGLYIPAIAWPAFVLIGILWAQRKNSALSASR